VAALTVGLVVVVVVVVLLLLLPPPLPLILLVRALRYWQAMALVLAQWDGFAQGIQQFATAAQLKILPKSSLYLLCSVGDLYIWISLLVFTHCLK